MSESDLISENPNLCTCSDGDPSTPHEPSCPIAQFARLRRHFENLPPAEASPYDSEYVTKNETGSCNARGDEPHAPDCPDPVTTNAQLGAYLTAARDQIAPDLPRSAVELAMAQTDSGRLGQFTDVAMERVPETCATIGCPLNTKHPGPCVFPSEVARYGDLTKPDTPTRINEDGVAVPDLRSPREVAIGSNPYVQKREALQREMVSSQYTMRRRGRMIPERGRMVVARVEWDEKIGSIFILDGHKKQLEQSNQEAVIMACGPLRIDPATGKEIPMRFSIQEAIGKHIVIREHSGIEFVTHDENGKEIICYWIGQSEIWGWLEPYPGDEANSPEIWKAIAYLGEEAKEPE